MWEEVARQLDGVVHVGKVSCQLLAPLKCLALHLMKLHHLSNTSIMYSAACLHLCRWMGQMKGFS